MEEEAALRKLNGVVCLCPLVNKRCVLLYAAIIQLSAIQHQILICV